MKVLIQIIYMANENKVMQRASFPLKRRKPEEVAYEWWRQIRVHYETFELLEVTANEEGITDKVKELDAY